MSSLFYNIGRKAGHSLIKGKYFFKSFFGTEEEALRAEHVIGCDLASRIKQQLKLCQDQSLQTLLDDIGNQLTQTLKNTQRKFKYYIVISEDMNAFALPGGFIFTTQPILSLCQLEKNEIAFILSHEIAHVVLGHPFQRILTNCSFDVLSRFVKTGGFLGNIAKQTLTLFLKSSYSRKSEFKADLFAVRLMHLSGFDPHAAITLIKKLDGAIAKSSQFNYFSSHPPLEERIMRIKSYIEEYT